MAIAIAQPNKENKGKYFGYRNQTLHIDKHSPTSKPCGKIWQGFYVLNVLIRS